MSFVYITSRDNMCLNDFKEYTFLKQSFSNWGPPPQGSGSISKWSIFFLKYFVTATEITSHHYETILGSSPPFWLPPLIKLTSWPLEPNLNNSKTCQPFNNVNLELMRSVGGKFRNNKLSDSNKHPEYTVHTRTTSLLFESLDYVHYITLYWWSVWN